MDRDAAAHQARFEEALALQRKGDFRAAERICLELLGRRGDHFEAMHLLGVVALQQRHAARAAELFGEAIALRGDVAAAHCDLGKALVALKRPAQALSCFERATALDPAFAEAHAWRGEIMVGLRRLEQAAESYRIASGLLPNEAALHRNLGHVLTMLRRHDEAFAAYDAAFCLDPERAGIEGHRLYARMHLCDWGKWSADCGHLLSSVRAGKASTQPFILLAVPSTPAEQLGCASAWTELHFRNATPRWRGERYDHDRIRIAYLSADFRQHAASILMAGMFERHDRSRFEISAISFGTDDGSAMRARLEASFEHFVEARELSDDGIADLIRSREIDIAVDLMGYTTNSRTGILARRPAPVQAHYMGFPGTMGAPFLDYVIADRTVIPDAERACYSEKIVSLPHSYFVNDATRPIADRAFTRAELGLPERGFVFCCFNGSHKITPETFDGWMRILKQVDGSVLWLLAGNPATASNLKREATTRGVDPARLIFAARMQPAEHLARHRAADLLLDTLPYNAHTTAADALWAGLPALTHSGGTFAGRVAASLLGAIGLGELVTATAAGYERLAVELATDARRLAAIRARLAANRLTTPLFDTRLFTAHMEAGFVAMHERHRAGLPPDHLPIPAIDRLPSRSAKSRPKTDRDR
jgi:predicted O-linked N-acetylglucosamine transferase (SPINDLY family)